MSNFRLYPISAAEIEVWSRQHGTTLAEATDRFIQFVVLQSVAASNLGEHLCFKGGNALRFVYGSPRSTLDLDFTADSAVPDDAAALAQSLDSAVRRTFQRYGAKGKLQSVRRKPPSADSTWPTYSAKVGYQMPGDRHFAAFDSTDTVVPKVVRLEISINDVVCGTTKARLSPESIQKIVVCTELDIIAEKLRAILQQRTRNRYRKQDVFDIALAMRRAGGRLDTESVADWLQQKCAARRVDLRKSLFDEEIRERAAFEYDQLRAATGDAFIPFEEAWLEVMALVQQLPIPD